MDAVEAMRKLCEDIRAKKVKFVRVYEAIDRIEPVRSKEKPTRIIDTRELTDLISESYAGEHSGFFIKFVTSRLHYHGEEGHLDADFFQTIKRT